ncbi:MAG: Spy/CpxP family protein refolding chaperone [Bacteroidales bacterium]
MNDKHLRAWFVVFVIAVFGAGIGAGLILDRYLAPRPPRPGFGVGGRGRSGGGPMSGQGPGMLVNRLVSQLQLTADQQKKVDDILAKRRSRLEAIRGEVRAKFDAEQRELRDEIRNVLTPDQQKRFDEWLRDQPLTGPGMGPGMRGMGRGRGMGPGRGGPPGQSQNP